MAELAERIESFEDQPNLIAPKYQAATQESPEGALFNNYPQRYYRAYEKLAAPVDEMTQIPLPVLPPDKPPPFGKGDVANWHHHYHPSNSELLTSASGLAVRHVRLQLLPVNSHHNRYHGIFKGPEILPKTNQERFGHIVLACAGYVPAFAIDVHKDDPSEPVEMSARLRRRLQTKGELEVRGHPNISNFMRNYLVKQDLSTVDDKIIQEFLYTRDIERKKELGHMLLAIASEIAVEPVESTYQRALDYGLVISRISLPTLVKSQISGPKTSRRAIKALHRRLTKSGDYLQPEAITV